VSPILKAQTARETWQKLAMASPVFVDTVNVRHRPRQRLLPTPARQITCSPAMNPCHSHSLQHATYSASIPSLCPLSLARPGTPKAIVVMALTGISTALHSDRVTSGAGSGYKEEPGRQQAVQQGSHSRVNMERGRSQAFAALARGLKDRTRHCSTSSSCVIVAELRY
jgi:hypothetical protein